MSNIRKLPLDAINATGGTQSRAELNQSTVSEYAEALGQGAEFPPVVVFSDGAGSGNWLADGFHRYHSHRAAGIAEIICDVRVGTRRDAVLFSVGANSSHGLRRTNEDKRNAVQTLLLDPEWTTWSNNAIAKACAVSDKTVATYRAEHLRKSEDGTTVPTKRTVERNGTTYEQDTSRIGKPSVPTPAAAPPAVLPTIVHADAPVPVPAASAQGVRVTLVQQVQQQQAATDLEQDGERAESHTDPSDEVDPFYQLRAEYDEVVGERDRLKVRNTELEALLAQNDLASQVDHWRSNFEGISGRNAGLIKKLNQVEPEADAQREILKQIRLALGVERNSEIVPALRSRRVA